MIKDHPTDPDKVVYESRKYDLNVNAMAKPEWVGLTDEEIDIIRSTPMSVENGVGFNIYTYARAIEAKLKQKNGYAEEKNT